MGNPDNGNFASKQNFEKQSGFTNTEEAKRMERAKYLEIPPDVKPGTAEMVGCNLKNAIFINEEFLAKDPNNKIIRLRLDRLKGEKAMLDAVGINTRRHKKIIEEVGKKGDNFTEEQIREKEKKFSAGDMYDLVQEYFVDRFKKSKESGNTHDYMEGYKDGLSDIDKLIEIAGRLQDRLINEEGRECGRDYNKEEKSAAKKPILEIKTGANDRISFSSYDLFDPKIGQSESLEEIPVLIEKYLFKNKELMLNNSNVSTYNETVKKKDWDKELFAFVSSYLKNEGADIAKVLGFESLKNLTPRQAVYLANEIVVELTKYNNNFAEDDISNQSKKNANSKADNSTVLQLLEEGRKEKNNPDWEGNVVCRNSACMVKAVFEALKENQTDANRLRNSYCLYEADSESFAPKRESMNVTKYNRIGHAWNTFIVLSKNSSEMVITDTTWAKRNPKTKKIERLDYTFSRMEPLVNAFGSGLDKKTPDKENQLKHILSFYEAKMEKPGETGGHSSLEEDKQFYATRALKLMMNQGVPKRLPKSFVENIEQEYLKIADDVSVEEIETVYKISKDNSDFDFQNIIKKYFKDRQLSDYHSREFIFLDDNLQKAAFEELKLHKNFDNFLKESPEFRVRMREVLPQLFISFSPSTKPEDMAELKYLVSRQASLRSLGRIFQWGEISNEKLIKFFETARQSLREINPDKYEEKFAKLGDYQLVKQYDKIDKDLRV